MLGLEILDVGIGLVFVYLVLSLMCTAANELIANFTNARARMLRRGIAQLFQDTGFPADFENRLFGHSLIRSLVELRKKGPSYIPSRAFSTALLDLLSAGSPVRERKWDDVAAGIDAILETRGRESGGPPDSADPLVQTVRVLVDRAGHDLEKLEAEIGAWFDSAMDRVSAWYKRRTQIVVLVIAAIIAGASNADTIAIVDSLSRDSALRGALVAYAEASAQDAEGPEAIQVGIKEIEAIGVPLGWRAGVVPDGMGGWLQKATGLLLTALALSLGAPFWFDLLKKAINIRSVGLNPQEAEDRRRSKA